MGKVVVGVVVVVVVAETYAETISKVRWSSYDCCDALLLLFS